jgi:hypothetical protein
MFIHSSESRPAQAIDVALSASPLLRPILQQWDRIGLPDLWLVAGAVTQTVWNRATGLLPSMASRISI